MIAIAVVLTLVAWFSLSNHCALGAVVPVSEAASSSCPMHSAPAKKKKPATKTPCCKDVRAVIAKSVTASTAGVRLFVARDNAAEIFAQPVRGVTEFKNLGTGPPGWLSFAESVLQESMPAHAPPVS